MTESTLTFPRVERLKVRNYRVLRDVEFHDLTPLTVLLGPNGSGKSTVLDVFAFLNEAFTIVATHSPQFADALRPRELWIMDRGEDGFARTVRASGLPRLVAMVEAGGSLGDLWLEGYFEVGDPLSGPGGSA